MTEPIVVDSYAWIEYADGSDEGRRARSYIEGNYELLTPGIVIAELSDRATRTERREEWETQLLPFIRHHTTVVPINGEVSERAGQIKWEMRESSPTAGLADAIILASARLHDASDLTGKDHFLVTALNEEVVDVTN